MRMQQREIARYLDEEGFSWAWGLGLAAIETTSDLLSTGMPPNIHVSARGGDMHWHPGGC